MKIIVGGDTHGERNHVRWLLDKAASNNAEGVFILGDFGVWDHEDGGAFTKGVAMDAYHKSLKVWFLPGNHENYDILDRIEAENEHDDDGFVLYHKDAPPSLLYSPRGHRWTWNGADFLSLGGAYSTDKAWRVEADRNDAAGAQAALDAGRYPRRRHQYALEHTHARWWPQEEITDEQAAAAADGPEVDIMLAHDKPMSALLSWNRKDIPEAYHNQRRIQRVVNAVMPDLYLHGHFHYAYKDVLQCTDTHVFGLDCEPDGSRMSGGSGDRKLSWGVLELDGDSYRFHVQERTGEMNHRHFKTKGGRRDTRSED